MKINEPVIIKSIDELNAFTWQVDYEVIESNLFSTVNYYTTS